MLLCQIWNIRISSSRNIHFGKCPSFSQSFHKHKHPIPFYCDDISLKSPDTWIEDQNPKAIQLTAEGMNSREVPFWLWLTFPTFEFVNKIWWLSPNIWTDLFCPIIFKTTQATRAKRNTSNSEPLCAGCWLGPWLSRFQSLFAFSVTPQNCSLHSPRTMGR